MREIDQPDLNQLFAYGQTFINHTSDYGNLVLNLIDAQITLSSDSVTVCD